MVYRKRPIKRTRRTMKRTKRSSNLLRLTRPSSSSPHHFRRLFNVGTWAGNAAYVPLAQATGFAMNALPGVTDFTTLYDQYKVTHIQLRFHLRIEPGAQVAADASYPRLFYITDHDDLTPPSSIDDIRQNSRCKVRVLQPNKEIIVNFKPSILTVMYQSALASGYTPAYNKWVGMSNTVLPYYGLKWCVDIFNNVNYRLDVEGVAWFQCKSTK